MGPINLERDDTEHPVPEDLRSKFRQIAIAFAADDFQLVQHSIDGVAPVDDALAKYLKDSATSYGDALAPLNEATWERSIYRWMDGYWQFLVDLTTENEPVSDLALHAILDETSGQLQVTSVHVP